MSWFPLVAVGSYCYFKVPARARPNGGASRRRHRRGAARAVTEKFRLLDEARTTRAYRNNPVRPYRELVGEIWRPARAGEAAPLVVYSHGFMSSRREALYLARFLASHGYIVAAVDYPLTGLRARGRPVAQDIVNQPGDISFVIDYLLERNADPADELFGAIDPDRIAVAGLSYGALTSLLATYHRKFLDTRIQAVIAIAGPTSMLAADFYGENSVPSLLVYGDSDSLVRYDHHALPAFERMADATLVTLRKGSHTGFAQQGSTVLRFLRNPDSLACLNLRWMMDDRPWDFVSDLGGAKLGIVQPREEIAPLTEPLVAVAMKSARQQMFTALSVHAFLESRFADDQSTRQMARGFLHHTLPGENSSEVAVAA